MKTATAHIQTFCNCFRTDLTMKERIRERLNKLVSLEVTRTTRAANMECLKFGEELVTDKGDEVINIGQFGIHLQCPWGITTGDKILIGYNDLYEQSDQDAAKYDPDFDWDRPGVNLRDKKLQELIDKNLTVENITADNFGGFSIYFNDNIVLTTFPTTSPENEYWRLLDNRAITKGHFVVGGNGIGRVIEATATNIHQYTPLQFCG